jgi:hypothetical protein
MRTLILGLCLLMPARALAQQELSADYLDMNGVALTDTPETEAIPMAAHGQMTQLTLRATVTWGTTTQVIAKCRTSASEDSGYTWIDACHWDGSYYQCKPMEWRWNSTNSADGLLTLELRVNARYVKCRWDDPDNNTGTSVVTGTRGQP